MNLGSHLLLWNLFFFLIVLGLFMWRLVVPSLLKMFLGRKWVVNLVIMVVCVLRLIVIVRKL